LVAVVWTRDGRDWRLEADLTLAALKEREAHWRKAGLIPADVAAYSGMDGDRYLALWRSGEAGEKVVLYAGVPAKTHKVQTGVLGGKGYIPRRVQGLLGSDGVVRYCGVWQHRPGQSDSISLVVDDPEPAHAAKVLEADRLLIDVHVGPAAPRSLQQTWLAALQEATAVAQAQPGDLKAIYQQATALFHLGRDAEALKALDTILAKEKDARVYRYRALLHARAGRAEQANHDLAALSESHTNRALGLSTAAEVALYLGNAERAFKALDRAVEANPTESALLFEAARAHGRAAQLMQARQGMWVAGLAASPLSWPSLALPPRMGKASRHAERALALLERALASGYRDFAAVQSDTDLEVVHRLPGYRALQAQHGMRRSYAGVWQAATSPAATGRTGWRRISTWRAVASWPTRVGAQWRYRWQRWRASRQR
jgi:tetratricopeptide (TPR) repeat protein